MPNYLEPNGRVETSYTADGRKRIKREYDVKAPGVEPAAIVATLGDYATADAEFTDCRLVDKFVAKAPKNADAQVAVVVYEELPATAELQIGGNNVTYDADGRRRITATFLQFSAAAFVSGTVGTDTAPGDTGAVLDGVQKTETGKVRQITRAYVEATASEVQVGGDDVTVDGNGRRTVNRRFVQLTSGVYAQGTIGSTITTLSTTFALHQVQKSENAAIRTIARAYLEATTAIVQVGGNSLQYDENGRKTIEAQFIQLTSGSYVAGTIGSTTAPGDANCVLVNETKSEETSVRRIVQRFLEATSTLTLIGAETVDTEINGLRRRTGLYIGTTAASDPAGTVGTTTHATDTTLILAGKKVETSAAIKRATLVWIEPGILSKNVQTREFGLRLEAWVSVGTKQSPAGVVVSEEESNTNGVKTWTVVSMQNATGGSPTSGSFEFERYVPFTYPGRAKPYTKVIVAVAGNDYRCLDVYLSPPIETEVLATVKITYQTSNQIGALAQTKWQPTEWATLFASWIGWHLAPNSKVEGLRGYRSVDETEIVEAETDGTKLSILGSRVYGDADNVIRLQVIGGPPDPGGNTYTLDAGIDLAFVAYDGTKYHRRTVIEATIPAQDALPTP